MLRQHLCLSYSYDSESILRSIDAGIIVLDDNMIVRSWNRWSENVWGLRTEEVVGESFLDLDIGLPVLHLRRALHDTLTNRVAAEPLELEAMDRRGRRIDCRIRLSPLLHHKDTYGAVLIIEDVTERTRADAFARYLGRIIGRSLNEVYVLDPATFHFQLVNRGGEAKLGHSLDALRQIALHELMPDIDAVTFGELVAPLLSGEKDEIVFETRIESGHQPARPVEMCMQYFAQEQPPVLVAIAHDTAKRQSIGSFDGRREAASD